MDIFINIPPSLYICVCTYNRPFSFPPDFQSTPLFGKSRWLSRCMRAVFMSRTHTYVTNSYVCHELSYLDWYLLHRHRITTQRHYLQHDMYMYIHVYTCIYICMYIYIYKCTCIYHIFMAPSSPPDWHSANDLRFAMRHIYQYTRVYMYIYI